MDFKRVFIVVTMDCERPRTETNLKATGPMSWEDSDAFIRGYVKIAHDFNFPVSFFLHPEVAIAQKELFLELEKKGACIDGLHLHPWKFSDGKYRAHLGGMSEEDQRAIILKAIALYQSGLNRRPKYFRPGTFSANDATYRVLVDLGFRGGSLSVPGRIYKDLYAIWTGCYPDPHRANKEMRQLEGDLPFANMPLTCDNSKLEKKGEHYFYRDLRPDYEEVDYNVLVTNVVNQLKQRKPAIPVINLVTHNENDYNDYANRVCKNYITVLNEITKVCKSEGLEVEGTTIDKICDMVFKLPIKENIFNAV